MLILGNMNKSRGCFQEIQDSPGHKKFTLGTGVLLSLGGAEILTGPSAGYFVSGISFKQAERVQVIPCFGNNNYIYAFGHDSMTSAISLTLTVFMVDAKTKNTFGSALAELIKTYKDSRLSGNKGANISTITIGTCALYGYVTGMSSQTTHPELNIQTVELSFICPEVQGEK